MHSPIWTIHIYIKIPSTYPLLDCYVRSSFFNVSQDTICTCMVWIQGNLFLETFNSIYKFYVEHSRFCCYVAAAAMWHYNLRCRLLFVPHVVSACTYGLMHATTWEKNINQVESIENKRDVIRNFPLFFFNCVPLCVCMRVR